MGNEQGGFVLPTLYKKTSAGKIQEWKISVRDEVNAFGGSGAAHIETLYGQTDGKKTLAVDVITEGKNIGKANETTYLQQAEAEAQSQWEKKLKRGYVQNMDDAAAGKVDTNAITGGVTPMLAKSFDNDSHKITFPAFVQPKLDGHRCIAIIQNGEATLWSRTRKRITGVPHIERQLEAAFAFVSTSQPSKAFVFDGELYNHDYKDRFEELTSFIRSATPKPGHEVVQYWIYDMVDLNLTMEQRLPLLEVAREALEGQPQIVVIDTPEVADKDEMVRVFGVYVEAGFEGLMVRNKAGKYKQSRSSDLQKVKLFQDAEYEIIDVEEGRGKMAGKAIFVFKTETGETFNAKMVGELDKLSEFFVNKDKYIGKQMTVKFQGITNGNVPRFPVAMRFREDV
jgi:DNA ligase-1